MITIKDDAGFAKMRFAGRTVANVLMAIRDAAVPGVSMTDLDDIAAGIIRDRGCTPSFLGYHGYPATICTSPNNVIVHGIPDGYTLKEGDILSVDVGAIYEGYHGDAARTFAIGEVAEAAGFSVVREYVGHGIGEQMHEEPQIPNYGEAGKGMKLKKGMAICIEPMVNMGDWRTELQDDGWTVTTADGSLSAHFENTVAITPDGVEVMTAEDGG